jgi:hypothetical protein
LIQGLWREPDLILKGEISLSQKKRNEKRGTEQRKNKKYAIRPVKGLVSQARERVRKVEE